MSLPPCPVWQAEWLPDSMLEDRHTSRGLFPKLLSLSPPEHSVPHYWVYFDMAYAGN